jgi:hypothetical protein
MLTCPKCHSGVPEGMRFCLQCGSSVAPPAPPARSAVKAAPPAEPAHHESATVPLKIAPTPVMSPRAGTGMMYPRPSFREDREIDEEALKKSFERPLTHPGAIVCRFCKGPLDLDGDFCEQCGAPVSEAAPPGAIAPKPAPPRPAQSPVAPPPAQSRPAQAAPDPLAPVHNTMGLQPNPATPPASPPPAPSIITRQPAPVPPTPPTTTPADDSPAGLMGRLKGMFKKS